MNNLLQNLNPEQLAAVRHKDGPLLIVAGAGTGKTTVIAERMAYLIERKLAGAEEILALTFTEKAAGEMADRVGDLLPYGYFDLWISTFHSFSERILKEHGLAIGLSTDFKLLNEFEQWALVKKNLGKFDLDYYRPLGAPTKFIRALLKHFSRAKDEDISPKQYLDYADGLKQDLDGMLGGSSVIPISHLSFPKPQAVGNPGGKGKNAVLDPRLRGDDKKGGDDKEIMADKIMMQEAARLNEVADAYHVYQQLLLANNALDFGDLINYSLQLFRERPAILGKYRQQFKYIMLDEFQDTNWSQYELVKILAGPAANLTVVGDDDQCLPGGSLILTKQGEKRIDKIAAGELVATAVGKGYLSYSPVQKVLKNKKLAKLITFTLAGGAKITATDNHKMFCRVSPWFYAVPVGQTFYYVYLMNKQELGWRLGMTSNLASRLKLERSADRLVALRSFSSEAEARYHETLWSLKYGIPTVCFQERPGIMTKKIWSEKLYQNLNVEAAAIKLASDLGINLREHQVCLAAVNRGGKVRIKINLAMCVRNYRSKHAKGIFLTSPKILHELTVETSHQPMLKKLRRLGFNLIKAKKGRRLRLASVNLPYLGRVAQKIERATGGIIENSFKVGSANVQHKKALVISAGNILPGMYLPVVENKKIVYRQIIDRREEVKKMLVYDLEVAPTHNFVADRVIVHNSIFRFRGASMSNILQFAKDYPRAKKIILTRNYRSRQNLLDLSYEFIKQNNPNRLEWQLENPKPRTPNPNDQKLNKKLIAENKGQGEIEVIRGADLAEEVSLVAEKIVALKNKDPAASWDDFAILVRANDSANVFMDELDRRGLPYSFGSRRGLYLKPVILDVMAYFKLLDNYHESVSLWRILNLPVYNFTDLELMDFSHLARKKAWSLYEVLNRADGLSLSAETGKKIKPLLALIAKHAAAAREKTASEIFLLFLNESGYLKYLAGLAERENLAAMSQLNQFLKRLRTFTAANADKSVKNFLAELNLEMEAGEAGELAAGEDAGPEAIKILTVHGAKGLEFKYVFIANLVDKRFPTPERSEPINLPAALIKEILPAGNTHLEEERRLFYVAMTRAKAGLYFSLARDYGGQRAKQPSRFLVELGLIDKDKTKICHSRAGGNPEIAPLGKTDVFMDPRRSLPSAPIGGGDDKPNIIPPHFSYSQLVAYSNCPYQYRFAHILKIPVLGKEQFSFGKTMHATLQKLFTRLKEKKGLAQGELFGNQLNTKLSFPKPWASGKPEILSLGKTVTILDYSSVPTSAQKKKTGCLRGDDKKKSGDDRIDGLIAFEEILELYEQSWIDDWYKDKTSKQERKKQGREILKIFYEKHQGNWPEVLFLEKGFNLKLVDPSAKLPSAKLGTGGTGGEKSYTLRGVIDRIDKTDDGLKLVDYKTGRAKKNLSFQDKEQLFIYQLAASELFKPPVSRLAFYYLADNSEVEFIGGVKDLEKMKAKIISTIKEIGRAEFPPRPGQLCAWCDYREICEYRE